MDDIDRAQAQEEMARDLAIRAAIASAPVLPPTGACHWCDEPVAAGARFCNTECCRDFERDQNAVKRNRGRA